VKNERIRAWIARELETRRVSRAGCATLGVSYLRENDRLLRRLRRRLGQVRCPHILALHAEEDEVASPGKFAPAGIGAIHRGDLLRTVTIRNSFHMISIDNDRQQVVRETVDFVRSLPASPSLPPVPSALNMTPDIDQTIAQILVDKFHIEANACARGRARRTGPGLAGPDGIRLRDRRRLQLRIPEERLDPRQGGITLSTWPGDPRTPGRQPETGRRMSSTARGRGGPGPDQPLGHTLQDFQAR
jgi:hypothetical protein